MTTLAAGELAAVAEVLSAAGETVEAELSAVALTGGRSNLTFRVTDGRTRWVLRTPPRAGRTPSAHDVAREHRITSALGPTQVPVARAIALCEDESLIGGPFTLAAYVDGVTVATRKELHRLDDATLNRVVTALVEALANLHEVDPARVGLDGLARAEGYLERQLRRWSGQWGIVGSAGLQGLTDEVVTRLRDSLPAGSVTRLVHGDYRIDNTILDLQGETPTVAAVVDWELSTLGDPLADVATMCAYRDPAFDLVLGEPAAWTSARLPDVDQLVSAYESAGGRRVEHWDFQLGLAYFKIAVIAAGIDHRSRARGAAGPTETAGEAVECFLDLAHRALRIDG